MVFSRGAVDIGRSLSSGLGSDRAEAAGAVEPHLQGARAPDLQGRGPRGLLQRARGWDAKLVFAHGHLLHLLLQFHDACKRGMKLSKPQIVFFSFTI